jgi:hypothetical protein
MIHVYEDHIERLEARVAELERALSYAIENGAQWFGDCWGNHDQQLYPPPEIDRVMRATLGKRDE